MKYKTNPLTIGLIVIITAVLVGSSVFLWQNRTFELVEDNEVVEHSVECPQNWTSYEAQNFSFCYSNLWGAASLVDETHEDGEGKLFKIVFANEQYSVVDNAPSTPQLWWETNDFAPAVSDYSTTCFECINFDQSESEIIKAFGYEDKNAIVEKTKVDGQSALRVKIDYVDTFYDQGRINRLEYFVPNAFANYHFQAVISDSKADELNILMSTLSFKE
jgi:hypothetical protein